MQLLLRPSVKYISQDKEKSSWTKQAFACSPPEASPAQNFENITVTSNTDFILPNDTIKVGESLNSIIEVDYGTQ